MRVHDSQAYRKMDVLLVLSTTQGHLGTDSLYGMSLYFFSDSVPQPTPTQRPFIVVEHGGTRGHRTLPAKEMDDVSNTEQDSEPASAGARSPQCRKLRGYVPFVLVSVW